MAAILPEPDAPGTPRVSEAGREARCLVCTRPDRSAVVGVEHATDVAGEQASERQRDDAAGKVVDTHQLAELRLLEAGG
jgi:hypothetical protein